MLGKKRFKIWISKSMAQYRTGISKFVQHPCCDMNIAEIWASVMVERKVPKKENSEQFSEIGKVKTLTKSRPR